MGNWLIWSSYGKGIGRSLSRKSSWAGTVSGNLILSDYQSLAPIQLILSPALLKQKNCHFKVIDDLAMFGYGTITYLAFGPETLSKLYARD
jgi:hypothetical protein